MNALLDYGTSSSSSNDSDTEEDNDGEENCRNTSDDEKWKVPKLPKPSLENDLKTSVFSNPFVREEMAKAAILEKHVKMVPGKSNIQMINGKKICYNHRRGRCRFGNKCKYAHDTDVQKTPEELEADKQKLKTVVCEGAGTMSLLPPPVVQQFNNVMSPTDDSVWEENVTKKRRRPGLSQGLIPGQKVLKMYHEQKFRDGAK